MSSAVTILKSFSDYGMGFMCLLMFFSVSTWFTSDKMRPPAPDPAFANVECCLILITLLDFGHGFLLLSESVTGEFPPLRSMLCLRPLTQIFSLDWRTFTCSLAFLTINVCQAAANMDWMLPLIALCVKHLSLRVQEQEVDTPEHQSNSSPSESDADPLVARLSLFFETITDDNWAFLFVSTCTSAFLLVSDPPSIKDLGMAGVAALSISVITWFFDQSLLADFFSLKPEPRLTAQTALTKAYDVVAWSLLFSVIIAVFTLPTALPVQSDVLLGVSSSFLWIAIFFGLSLPIDLARMPLWGYVIGLLISETAMVDFEKRWLRRTIGFSPILAGSAERALNTSTSARAFKYSSRIATLVTCIVIGVRTTIEMHPRLSHVDWPNKTWPPEMLSP